MSSSMTGLQLRRDDLSDPRIERFMQEHLNDMHATSPPESVHALDMAQLRAPGIDFYTAWLPLPAQACVSGAYTDALVATGALKRLSVRHAELKSMRTAATYRAQGLGQTMLQHLLLQARLLGYTQVSLETGTQPFFAPAVRLYARHGFVACAPFADYTDDPNSCFMTWHA